MIRPRPDSHLVLALAAVGVGCLVLAQYWHGTFDIPSDIGCDFSAFLDVYLWASGEVFCAEPPDGFYSVLAARAAGGIFLLAALALGQWRGRRAAKAGSPWPVRRLMLRLAAAVDRRLPGYHAEMPRQPTWPWSLLLVILVGLAAVGASWGWDRYQRHREEEQLERSRAVLAVLELPATMDRVEKHLGCTATADSVCATSDLTPAQLKGELLALLQPGETVFEGNCRVAAMICHLAVVGRYRGEPILASVSFHLATTRPVPPGAKRLGTSKLYYLHSDIGFFPAGPEP